MGRLKPAPTGATEAATMLEVRQVTVGRRYRAMRRSARRAGHAPTRRFEPGRARGTVLAMADEPVILQVPDGGELDRFLAASPPEAVRDGRVVVTRSPTDDRGV